MKLMQNRRAGTLMAIAATATFGLAACGGSDAGSSSTTSSSTTSSSPSMSSPSMSSSSSSAMAMSGPVGPGCADYAAANASGPGSVGGMAMDPLATAAGNNPLLKTLTAAVSGQLNPQVNLVNDLNGGEFTVFAPVDDAFAKVDPATIDTLKTDSATLQKILTYHVVQGRIAPDQIVGTHKTLEGGEVTVAGTPEALTVNGSSNVICGGVSTANATVYLVDSVLMPPA